MSTAKIIVGDCRTALRGIADASVQCAVTSPPYWGLRDYGAGGQIGLETTPAEYIAALVAAFDEVHRVLRDDGVLWLNLGDSYANGGCGARDPEKWPKQSRNEHMPKHAKTEHGLKNKDMVGIPWRVALALQARGWWLRSDIIWSKPNPMPESVTDRPQKAHEYIFLLAKSENYFYNAAAIKEPAVNGEMRHRRTVWTVPVAPYPGAHFATFPPDLIEPCVRAGAEQGSMVLDPFCGTGTVGFVATGQGRNFIGVEINPDFARMALERIGLFARMEAPHEQQR